LIGHGKNGETVYRCQRYAQNLEKIHILYWYSGFQASVEFRLKPRQISPTNPTWHPLRIKFCTEISKIPNNSFIVKSPMKSDNESEKIDQRSVCSQYALYASLHSSDVA